MAAHRYWRINFLTNAYGGYVTLCEVSYAVNPGDPDNLLQTNTTGQAIASGVYSGLVPANAIDSNLGTYSCAGGAVAGNWWGYDFGAGNALDIKQVKITCRSDAGQDGANQAPTDWTFDFSDDGDNWTSLSSFTSAPWTSGAQQTFAVPPVPVVTAHRYWRIAFLSSAYGAYPSLAEVMFAENANEGDGSLLGALAAGGSTIASDSSNGASINAVDGDLTKYWNASSPITGWWGFDYGAGVAKAITQVKIIARNDSDTGASTSPGSWTLDWSDNEDAWTTVQKFASKPWTAGSEQVFTVGIAGGTVIPTVAPVAPPLTGKNPPFFRSSISAAGGSATSVTINLPSATQAGDVTLLSAVQTSGPSTLTVPAGWTPLFNASGTLVCYRLFQAGDPSSVTVTSAVSGNWGVMASSYRNVDTSNPIDAINSCTIVGYGGDFHAAQASPAYDEDMLVCMFFNYGDGDTWILPPTLTSRVSTTAGPSVALADHPLVGGASPGEQIASGVRNRAGPVLGIQVVLKSPSAELLPNRTQTVTIAGMANGGFGATSSSVDFSTLSPATGDLVLAFVVYDGAQTSAPDGYVRIQADRLSAYSKVFTQGDPTVVNIGVGGNPYNSTVVLLLRNNAGPGTPPSIEASQGSTGAGSVSTASLTPATPNDLLIAAFGKPNIDNNGLSSPAGTTLIYTAPNVPALALNYKASSANPSGVLTSTSGSGNADSMNAIVMLLTLAGGTPISPTSSLCLAFIMA